MGICILSGNWFAAAGNTPVSAKLLRVLMELGHSFGFDGIEVSSRVGSRGYGWHNILSYSR